MSNGTRALATGTGNGHGQKGTDPTAKINWLWRRLHERGALVHGTCEMTMANVHGQMGNGEWAMAFGAHGRRHMSHGKGTWQRAHGKGHKAKAQGALAEPRPWLRGRKQNPEADLGNGVRKQKTTRFFTHFCFLTSLFLLPHPNE